MKALIKQLIPPLLLKVFKQSITPPHPAYKTYEEALKHCPKEAYEDTDIVKVVVEKNIIYQQNLQRDTVFDLGTLRTLIALGLSKTSNSLNVIDFGGGGGYHYTIASNAFGDKDSLKWNVVETTAMANEAKRIANNNLKFFDNIADATKDLGLVDLVFTSGALQCCPQPLFFLKELINVKAKYLFITRTSFTDSSEQVANIQKSYLSTNGPGPLPAGFKDKAVYYPNVFVCKQQIEEMLSEHYHIQFKIIEDKAAYRVGNKEIDMYGYFCIRKS
jgi:putative methyltransferase (TIGR04325 family)